MNSPNNFTDKFEEWQQRLSQLYQQAIANPKPPASLLPNVITEVGIAAEKLQLAVEQLNREQDALTACQSELEIEQEKYQALFEFLPNPCIVTNPQGIIQQANAVAGKFLNCSENFLVGKSLGEFIASADREIFDAKLAELQRKERIGDWMPRLHPYNRDWIELNVRAIALGDRQGQPSHFHWLFHPVSPDFLGLKLLEKQSSDICQNRPKHCYLKGDLIPLNPETIWIVDRGLVKLSTISDPESEVLMGLVGSSMAFGASTTSLPIYEAIALSERVELISISLPELAASPHLRQALLPRINQRLRQTEAFLAISGKRKVNERLYNLLKLLKREIGEPVKEGTRLKVRLTHKELADACCTTRVTITRMLQKFKKSGRICYDDNQHIIWVEKRNQ